MAAKHGTRRRYIAGCHCPECTNANTTYQANYRQRRIGAEPTTPSVAVSGSLAVTPGPVEIGVQEEIGDSAELRPGLAETALAFARLLDNPGARNVHPSAAKVLAGLLGELGRVGVPRRRSQLALVRSMTEKDGA